MLKGFCAAGILFFLTVVFLCCPIETEGQTMEAGLPPEELLVGYITAFYTPREETGLEPEIPAGGVDGWPDMVRSVKYEGVEALAGIPSEIGVQIWDRGTESAGYGRLMLLDAEPLCNEDGSARSYWKDDFSMVATFRAYGAETYELNGKRIAHQEDEPPLWGSETELLGLIGASPQDYQITEMEWAGECYQDAYGIEYRNALIKGRRKVTDYQAVYQGRALFPKTPDRKTDLEPETGEEAVTEETARSLEDPYPSEAAPSSETDILQETEPLSDSPILAELDPKAEADAGHILPEELPQQLVLETDWKDTADLKAEGESLAQRLFAAARTGFVRVSQELERWVYERFAIYVPGTALMGMGMILSAVLVWGIFYLYRWKRKNFL